MRRGLTHLVKTELNYNYNIAKDYLLEKMVYSGKVWDGKVCNKLNLFFFSFLFIAESIKGGNFFWTLEFFIWYVHVIWTCLTGQSKAGVVKNP